MFDSIKANMNTLADNLAAFAADVAESRKSWGECFTLTEERTKTETFKRTVTTGGNGKPAAAKRN
jgi:hypothetical protein